MLFVITIWVFCSMRTGSQEKRAKKDISEQSELRVHLGACWKGGALKSFNMLEGGYLKNMGAISRGLEIIWDKKQFLLHPLLQIKL